jgi:hypothetical protein
VLPKPGFVLPKLGFVLPIFDFVLPKLNFVLPSYKVEHKKHGAGAVGAGAQVQEGDEGGLHAVTFATAPEAEQEKNEASKGKNICVKKYKTNLLAGFHRASIR